MKICLMIYGIIHCLITLTLNGQVETTIPNQPNIIFVDSNHRDAFQNLEAGNYNLALEQFDELLKENPSYISALMGKAKSHFQLGNYQEAYETYLKVSNKDPSHMYAIEGLGQSALFLNQPNLALSYFKKVLEEKPDNAKIYHAIAISQMCKNLYFNAAESAKIASLLYDKKGIKAHYSLILAYFLYAQINDEANMSEVFNYIKSYDLNDTWPSSIFQYIKKEIGSTELISRVQNEKQEIEAHTYIGLKLKQEKQFQQAATHLDWVQNIEKYNLLETLIAKHILRRYNEWVMHLPHD